ncbi:4-azaleucine resistance probable transporter AzlC [Halopenitus malekzadehii]|uniref:4-azaleucine resistance probable transporter AzlC n=1 Tax=Halopenitus malekzadehii TaxID=1267564 RepID=A0A1H6ITS3_9EURY|nr:AzlC family ABC transporter permease [Halopenitus malekzadehii]SEH49842.1 4-azaleucine resistance probable transporter AzlC [Halopenitus malekzadehii]
MHADFRTGARDVIPVLLGVAPFATVVGIAAIDAGLTPMQAIGMSLFVYAGSSQLAAIELLGETAPIVVVVFTAIIINLRMVMYSASIAPHLADYRRRTRAFLAYFLTDQAYALSLTAYENDAVDDERWYYLGVATPISIVWMVCTVIGVVLGAGIPESWGLSFAVPLVFLAILVPVMKDRPRTVAAAVSGVVAVALAGAPFNLGLPIGAVVGICAGLLTEVIRNR